MMSNKTEQLTTSLLLATVGAVFAVLLGSAAELFQLTDPQALIAAAIGATLTMIAYGGRNEGTQLDLGTRARSFR